MAPGTLYKTGKGGRSLGKGTGFPEEMVDALFRRLKRHGLWNSLLMAIPPLIVFFYLVIFLAYWGWVSVEVLTFLVTAGLVVVFALIFYYGRTAASARLAARLMDEKVGGKDRFLTLATINPSLFPSFLVARLRDETSGLLHRISFKRDFPYRMKRAFIVSLAGSLTVVLLFHLLLQRALPSLPHEPFAEELAALAQQLSQVPRSPQLAQSLHKLAVEIRQQDLSTAERHVLVQDLLRKIEEQLAGEQQGEVVGREILGQAANVLRELEEGIEKGAGQEGGGLKTGQLGGEGGQGKESGRGEGGEGQGEVAGWGSRELRGGKPARSEVEEEGKGKGKGKGKAGGADRLRREGRKGREIEGTAMGETEGRGGKSKKEEIPRGKVPERFLQPGEAGEQGIKGARFVTVELPEEVEPSSPSGITKGRTRPLRPKVPVSNIPLPRRSGPDAPRETQLVPLEYQGLIR